MQIGYLHCTKNEIRGIIILVAILSDLSILHAEGSSVVFKAIM